MNKQSICRALEKTSESQGFVTATQCAHFMGLKTSDYVKKKFLIDLECIDGKYYFIPDVAEAILNYKDLR